MTDTAPFEQNASGAMAYPDPGTLNRLFFKSPLVWWRMGMGAILGHSMLVLTTWGRKSHFPRHTMLSYTPLDERFYVAPGWGKRCDWYQNLLVDPHVTLQVWSEALTGEKGECVIPAQARGVIDIDEFRKISERLFETGGDSHFAPWLSSLGIEYDLEDMVAKRNRVYQVALDPQPSGPGGRLPAGYPAPMDTDLKWVWAALAGAFSLGWLVGRRKK